MPKKFGFAWTNVALSTLVAGLSLCAIVYLSWSVLQDLRLLNSARSDNVQWTLSQSEVEFLVFDSRLTDAMQQDGPDLGEVRRSFDVFYSRIGTLSQSRLYAGLREQTAFSTNLARARQFLSDALPVIDSDDAGLQAGLSDLKSLAADTRPSIRALSNSGLNYFATESDRRRTSISATLTQLAAAVGFLLLLLLLLAIYLGVLNAQNVRRRKELAQTSERMKIVTGTSLDAVIVSDAMGRILDFNTAAETTFGYAAADVMGGELGALIVPDHHVAAHAEGMARMRANVEKRVVGKGRVKLDAKRANGDVFPVELAIQSAQTEDGKIFIAFLRDISHRVKAENQLLEARDRAVSGEKAKTDFLATMSHEIRTPLNGLLGNLTLLQDTRLSPEQAQYINNMNTSGRLLMSHISDVLDITKYDADKLRLRPVAMNVSALLQDIVDSQSGAALANDSVLDWGWTGPPINWIHADRERIQHILINIIGNAVKFTQAGRITVQAEGLANGDLCIGVRDTGIGMSPELQRQVFDDFVTGDRSYDRDVSGTGLGLGIARRFVQALGGDIGMQSDEGDGSYFWVRFPIQEIAPPDTHAPVSDPAEPDHRRTVLLVEDNEINRLVAREMLMKSGHVVKEAHDGKAGVQMAQAERFDLILMDISMPVMDGRTATRAIRAGTGLSRNTAIIALTANAMAEEQDAFLSDGMNAILTKPLSRDALEQIVRTWAGAADEDAVSHAHLSALRDTVGAQNFDTLLDRFLTEIDTLTDWLADVTAHDPVTVQARAHKAAGSAGVIGATELHGALLVLENAARSGHGSDIAQSRDRLASIWADTRATLVVLRSG